MENKEKLFHLQIVFESWGGTGNGNESNNEIIISNDNIDYIKENFRRLKMANELYKKIDFKHPEKNDSLVVPYYITFEKHPWKGSLSKEKTITKVQFIEDNTEGFYWECVGFFSGSDYSSTLVSAQILTGMSMEF